MNLNKILVPIDYSDYSERALEWGAGLADKFDAQLFLVHVIPRPSPDLARAEETAALQFALDNPSVYYAPSPPPLEGMTTIDPIEMAQNELEDHALARLTGKFSAIPRIGVGKPAEEIVRIARHESVYLIVMGTHGRTGVRHLLAGSVAETVMRTAPCPVFTVKATTG